VGTTPPPQCPSYRVDELVDQPAGHVGLADDALLVVLPYGAAQLVIVHSWSVLPDAPQLSHVGRVLDFKYPCWEGEPSDTSGSGCANGTYRHL